MSSKWEGQFWISDRTEDELVKGLSHEISGGDLFLSEIEGEKERVREE